MKFVFLSVALRWGNCQYADQSKMSLAEKHAYWDELLEIRRLRDRDPTTLEIGEVAVLAQYYEDIRDWIHRNKSPEEMDKFYERLNKRKTKMLNDAEEKREVYRERIRNVTETLAETEDEWEFQQVWDAVYPEKIPGSMRASKSEWMLKQDFRKRAEELKKEEQKNKGQPYKPSFLTNEYRNEYPEEAYAQEAEDELFDAHEHLFEESYDSFGDYGDIYGTEHYEKYQNSQYNEPVYQDPDEEEEVMAEEV